MEAEAQIANVLVCQRPVFSSTNTFYICQSYFQ